MICSANAFRPSPGKALLTRKANHAIIHFKTGCSGDPYPLPDD